MPKTVVFCSTQHIPSDALSREAIEAIARSLNADKAMGFVMKSRSDWKNFLGDSEVSEVVLVGVDDPAEYGVPLEGLTPMATHIIDRLVPCKFQVIDRKGLLIFSNADLANAKSAEEIASV